jgi:hypothetical protein
MTKNRMKRLNKTAAAPHAEAPSIRVRDLLGTIITALVSILAILLTWVGANRQIESNIRTLTLQLNANSRQLSRQLTYESKQNGISKMMSAACAILNSRSESELSASIIEYERGLNAIAVFLSTNEYSICISNINSFKTEQQQTYFISKADRTKPATFDDKRASANVFFDTIDLLKRELLPDEI